MSVTHNASQMDIDVVVSSVQQILHALPYDQRDKAEETRNAFVPVVPWYVSLVLNLYRVT